MWDIFEHSECSNLIEGRNNSLLLCWRHDAHSTGIQAVVNSDEDGENRYLKGSSPLSDHEILPDKLLGPKGCVSCQRGHIILSLFLGARFSAEGNWTRFIIEVVIVAFATKVSRETDLTRLGKKVSESCSPM